MKKPRFEVLPKGKVLLTTSDAVFLVRGNTVYKTDHKFRARELSGSFDCGWFWNSLAKFRWTSRLARLGFHGLYAYRSTFVGIQKGHIVLLDKASGKFVSVFSDFRGSRPLSLLITPGNEIYFGEYFGNAERAEVHIYKSVNGNDWIKAYTFEPGAVRHIHGMVWDAYKQGIWVLTGDSNQESGLWFTDDDFKTLRKYSDNSQKSRAVEIVPISEDKLLVPMDTPLTQNQVNWFDVETGSFSSVLEVEGSVFHIIETSGLYCLSTVTEPSEVNKTKKVYLYVSLDGRNWAKLLSIEKDFVPVRHQKYFGYAEISFAQTPSDTEYIYAHARAIRGHDGRTLRWKVSEVKQMLNDKFS
ncbi:MAG: hypothetical protein HEP71_28090 [Roseivirga sp.]|nr:hypothetical protein [Roseivirga sp.]